MTGPLLAAARRSYYSGTVAEFCAADRDEIFARMARQNDFDLTGTQREAWLEQAAILARVLAGRTGAIYLEFKVGERTPHAHDLDQVIDYALDLRHFHEGSHNVDIAPVLICTEADRAQISIPAMRPSDCLFDVATTNADGLARTIDTILGLVQAPDIDIAEWGASRYKPTPTIIEATLALYRGHSVTEISRADASATNLSTTAGTVGSITFRTRWRICARWRRIPPTTTSRRPDSRRRSIECSWRCGSTSRCTEESRRRAPETAAPRPALAHLSMGLYIHVYKRSP